MGGNASRDGTQESVAALAGESATGGGVLPGIDVDSGVRFSRRRFISYASRVGIALAAVPGAVVGWAPSAEAISNCAPGTQGEVTPNRCAISCFGHCSNYFSYCNCNPTHPGVCYKACNCLSYCGAAQAVVVCSHWKGIGCCRYC